LRWSSNERLRRISADVLVDGDQESEGEKNAKEPQTTFLRGSILLDSRSGHPSLPQDSIDESGEVYAELLYRGLHFYQDQDVTCTIRWLLNIRTENEAGWNAGGDLRDETRVDGNGESIHPLYRK
jgi:hypothetical protein